jgi:hypothetical protein
VFLFIYIIYRTLTDNIYVRNNYWASAEFFSTTQDSLPVASLEWAQNSPPVNHTYLELPYLVILSSK